MFAGFSGMCFSPPGLVPVVAQQFWEKDFLSHPISARILSPDFSDVRQKRQGSFTGGSFRKGVRVPLGVPGQVGGGIRKRRKGWGVGW